MFSYSSTKEWHRNYEKSIPCPRTVCVARGARALMRRIMIERPISLPPNQTHFRPGERDSDEIPIPSLALGRVSHLSPRFSSIRQRVVQRCCVDGAVPHLRVRSCTSSAIRRRRGWWDFGGGASLLRLAAKSRNCAVVRFVGDWEAIRRSFVCDLGGEYIRPSPSPSND